MSKWKITIATYKEFEIEAINYIDACKKARGKMPKGSEIKSAEEVKNEKPRTRS